MPATVRTAQHATSPAIDELSPLLGPTLKHNSLSSSAGPALRSLDDNVNEGATNSRAR